MLDKILSFLFPDKCLKCGIMISKKGSLCSDCWKNITFISEPYCKICGFAFEFEIGEDLICGGCIKKKPHFDHSINIFKYDSYSKDLIHKFKYGDKTYLSTYFAKWICTNNRIISLESYDHIIPVPLHKQRMKQRFYNQAALLSKDIAKIINVRFSPNMLVKIRHDIPQTKLPKNLRIKNVKNSFALNKKYEKIIKGSKIIIVDDVYTTGTTLNECSKILKLYKCKEISAITMART